MAKKAAAAVARSKAFPFIPKKPVGGALPEESQLYSTGGVDPETGRRITQGARRAASTRMKASVMGKRGRDEVRAAREEPEDLDELGEGTEPDDPPNDPLDDEAQYEEDEAGEDEDTPEPPAAAPAVAALTPAQTFFNERVLAPSAPSALPAPGLNVRSVSIDDADRLWDWLRADPDRGKSFFGQPVVNSLDLHAHVASFLSREHEGVGLLRAIYYEGAAEGDLHLGFAALSPILPHDGAAALHLYLSQSVRGRLATLTAPLVELAQQLLPGYKLTVMTSDPVQMRLYRQVLAPLGFSEHAVFVR